MIRTDLESIISNSGLVELVKLDDKLTPEEKQWIKKQLVSKLATDIEIEYFEQDGIEPSGIQEITTKGGFNEVF